MARSIDERFYHSSNWTACRNSYMSRVRGICERCGGVAEIVHHKTRLTEANYRNPSIAYGNANLEALCQSCHNKEHYGNSDRRERYTTDGAGNIITFPSAE
ncbi:HNH endonuclease [Clostridia bacterium]|nr:HNH endonuclease [Clostridia bacterium]